MKTYYNASVSRAQRLQLWGAFSRSYLVLVRLIWALILMYFRAGSLVLSDKLSSFALGPK